MLEPVSQSIPEEPILVVGEADAGERVEPCEIECRYRRHLGGVSVCWAASRISVVTDAECAQCDVPRTLEDVDCHYLQGRVTFHSAPTVQWICGATMKPVNVEDRFDCSHCDSCERRSPCRPAID